jgi:hypothetical protein
MIDAEVCRKRVVASKCPYNISLIFDYEQVTQQGSNLFSVSSAMFMAIFSFFSASCFLILVSKGDQ